MTRLMVDATMADKLKDMKAPLLLCDPMGHVIARIVPPSPYDKIVIPFTDEEIRNAEEETEEFTLADILAELEKQ